MRKRYTDTAPRSKSYLKSGFKIKQFKGLVTGMDKSNIPADAASAMLNLDCENGQLTVRRGYRNVFAKDSAQSTLKGAFFCQTYVSNVVKESLVAFRFNVGGNGQLRPYELEYDSGTGLWGFTEVLNGASSVSLNNSYWRSVCFHDTAYFFNAADTNPVYSYSLTTHNTFTPVKPPATPNPPSVSYYRSTAPDYAYKRYFGASVGYTTSDFSVDNTVLTTATKAITGNRIGATIKAAGAWSLTANLVHSATATDNSDNDVYTVTLEVQDAANAQMDFDNVQAVVTNGSAVSQTLVTSVVKKDVDTSGRAKSVVLYLKFAGKTRSTWATTVSVTLSGVVSVYSADTSFFVSPLVAGGIVDWGHNIQWRLAYTREESTTGLESGLSLAKNIDPASEFGDFVNGDPNFPLGSIPLVTMTATGDSDTLRLYAQQIIDGKGSAWRRIVSQADSSTTYTLTTTNADFAALDEYAPAPFDYTNLRAACAFKQWIVWLYAGGDKNVRHSRWGSAIAQASTDDAFKTSISQDDALRGANFTLNNDFQDQPLGGVQLGNALIIVAEGGIYVQFDTNGLPSGMTPPEVIAGAPGCKGPKAFCRWHDGSGEPIVVYLDSKGDQLWAVRVPRGYSPGQPLAQAAWEFGSLVRSGMDTYLFGGSVNRDDEATHVFVNERDDSLHLRYNVRELKLSRSDIETGQRQWAPYQYGTGQYADQWQEIVSFRASVYGYGIFGFRLNGAVDEFEQANLKYPGGASTDRYYIDITGQGCTPASLSSSVLTFALPTGWSSGTPVQVTSTANGLTANQTYYYGQVSYLTGSLYDTAAHARAGGGTGRATLTNTGAWASGAVTPLGRDDGSAIDSSIYWTSHSALGERRRPVRAHVQKSTMADVFSVVVTDDFGNSKTASVPANHFHGSFAVGFAAFAMTHKIVFTEGDSPVSGYWSEEEVLGQLRTG